MLLFERLLTQRTEGDTVLILSVVPHLQAYNALLTGKLGAQRVIFPSAATCYASIQPETRSLRLLHPDNTPIIVAIVTTMDSINIHF